MLAQWPLAEQLLETGLHPTAVSRYARAKMPQLGSNVKADKSRVNIVSDRLCDDIFSYIGPTLEQHRGCDILDLYPGSGLWSSKLHDFLEPRSHILMEPDLDFYRPFLQPLLDRSGVTAVQKPGIVWSELSTVLTKEYFPHQIPNPSQRNNKELLVTANLAFHPSKTFHGFSSVTRLLLHQLVHAIRDNEHVHKYGRVRMLIWTRSDEKLSFLPRMVQRRRRQALENELYCRRVHEVCGHDPSEGEWFFRDNAINEQSALAAVRRMRKGGFTMPSGREPQGHAEALAKIQRNGYYRGITPGVLPPTFDKPFAKALDELRQAPEEDISANDLEVRRALNLQNRVSQEKGRAKRTHKLQLMMTKIMRLKRQGAKPEAIAAAEADWLKIWDRMGNFTGNEFSIYRDNLHVWHQRRPVLQWDQRQYEPLQTQPTEFYPNVPMSLLDIQPRSRAVPLQAEPGQTSKGRSTHAAEHFDLVSSYLMSSPGKPVQEVLRNIWPGAADYIMPRWETLSDMCDVNAVYIRAGFIPDLPHAEPTARALNLAQYYELHKLWMEWPFRPELHELVGKNIPDNSDQETDGLASELYG